MVGLLNKEINRQGLEVGAVDLNTVRIFRASVSLACWARLKIRCYHKVLILPVGGPKSERLFRNVIPVAEGLAHAGE